MQGQTVFDLLELFTKMMQPTVREQNVEPAFYVKPTKTVKYARAIPSVDKEYLQIDCQQFAKDNNFLWTDSLLVTPSVRDLGWENPNPNHPAIEERMHNPLNNLVICEMDELGKGVFLELDASPIEKGTVIDIFAATLTEASIDDYSMAVSDSKSAVKSKFLFPAYNAKESGNRMRFVQHAPSFQLLEQYAVSNGDSELKKYIQDSNLALVPADYCGFPVTYLVTTRKIMPGEQLLFDYEWNESKWKKPCALFDKTGKVIAHLKNKTIEFIDSFTPTKEPATRTCWEELKSALGPYIRPIKLDNFDYKQRFKENVTYCIDIYLNRNQKENNIEEIAFLKNLLDELNAKDVTADDIFRLLGKRFGKQNVLPQTLLSMKKEITYHISQYIEGVVAANKVERESNPRVMAQEKKAAKYIP